MRAHHITLLLTIIIFTITNFNHQVLTKKSVLDKKHSNQKKNLTQHNKQNILHQNKQQHLSINKHHTRNNNLLLYNKGHNDNHNYKPIHKRMQSIHPILQSAYCESTEHLRIINGNIAKERQFPHTAAIYKCRIPTNNTNHCGVICGGSIISVIHVLTAAHCLHGLHPSILLVRVGVNDLRKLDAQQTIFQVVNASIHINYNNMTSSNDIGLIKLKHPMKFNAFVQPVCINGLHSNYHFPLLNVILAGWGFPINGGTTSDVLKYTKLYIKDFSNCRSYENEKVLEFCVNAFNLHSGFSCKGDSGSGLLPLDYNQNPVNIIVGLLSGGGYITLNGDAQCGNPMYFVNVTTHAQWINAAVAQ